MKLHDVPPERPIERTPLRDLWASWNQYGYSGTVPTYYNSNPLTYDEISAAFDRLSRPNRNDDWWRPVERHPDIRVFVDGRDITSEVQVQRLVTGGFNINYRIPPDNIYRQYAVTAGV